MAESAFFLKKTLTPLVLPPTSLLLCIVLGLLLLRRWPRLGKAACWTGVLLLLTLSLPSTAEWLVRSIAVDSAVGSEAARSAQAIVILGGGAIAAPEYGGASVNGATLERVRYGAKLAHELQLPVLVTGGAPFGNRASEANLMAATLRQSFGVEPKWLEENSVDTHQNAVMSAAVLKAAGISNVLLVTHDLHERRALREFAAARIDAIPASVSSVSGSGKRPLPQLLPNAYSLYLSSQALHEILGTLVLAPGKAVAH